MQKLLKAPPYKYPLLSKQEEYFLNKKRKKSEEDVQSAHATPNGVLLSKKQKYEEKREKDFFEDEAKYQEDIKRQVERYMKPIIDAKESGNAIRNIRPKSNDLMKPQRGKSSHEDIFPFVTEEAKLKADEEQEFHRKNREHAITQDKGVLEIDYKKEAYNEARWQEARIKETQKLEEEERIRQSELGKIHYPIGTHTGDIVIPTLTEHVIEPPERLHASLTHKSLQASEHPNGLHVSLTHPLQHHVATNEPFNLPAISIIDENMHPRSKPAATDLTIAGELQHHVSSNEPFNLPAISIIDENMHPKSIIDENMHPKSIVEPLQEPVKIKKTPIKSYLNQDIIAEIKSEGIQKLQDILDNKPESIPQLSMNQKEELYQKSRQEIIKNRHNTYLEERNKREAAYKERKAKSDAENIVTTNQQIMDSEALNNHNREFKKSLARDIEKYYKRNTIKKLDLPRQENLTTSTNASNTTLPTTSWTKTLELPSTHVVSEKNVTENLTKNLNLQNDSKKNSEPMAHLLAGAALGSLFSQATALPNDQKHYTQAEKDANTHPDEGSNDVDDFLYSARHLGKNGFAKALKLLGQSKSEDELKDILNVAKGVLEQSKGKAGLIKMLDTTLNNRSTMSPRVSIKQHIAEITSHTKLDPRDKMMVADKSLDATDLKSLTATGIRKVDVGYLSNTYKDDEYGYDGTGNPISAKRKPDPPSPSPPVKRSKFIQTPDPQAGPATGNAADPTMPKAGPQWAVPSIPKVDPLDFTHQDKTVYYKEGKNGDAEVFGLDPFQGAKEARTTDFLAEFPQYEGHEMFEGIRFRGDQGKVTKEPIGTKILDADKRVYLKMDNYGNPLAHSDTPLYLTEDEKALRRIHKTVSWAGLGATGALVAKAGLQAAGIPTSLTEIAAHAAGVGAATGVGQSIANLGGIEQNVQDPLSVGVPHPSITYDPNTGYSMPFKDFKQQYTNQNYSPYEAGPEPFEIPNPNIGQPVLAPLPANDANVFDSMNINPEKEPEYDPFRQAASMAWNGALNTGQILAAGYIGSTMGPMGGILFNHALNGMMSSLGKYDPGLGFQKSFGQSGQNTDGSNVVYDLTKELFKKKKKKKVMKKNAKGEMVEVEVDDESSDKVMEQAPQILNPMTVQAENQRVGATVLDAFAQGQVARSQVSETAKGYQNFYRDSMTPFAIDLPIREAKQPRQ